MTTGTLESPADARRRPGRGPRGYPLVGVAPLAQRDPLSFFERAARTYGDTVELNLAGQRVVMANRPDLVQRVLQQNVEGYRKSKFYDRLKPMLGQGFLTSEGDTWLAQRRAAAPAFKGSALAGMCRDMGAATEETLARWQPHADAGTSIDVAEEMMRLTLDIAVRTLFGSRIPEATAHELSGALAVVLREAEARIWSIVNPPLWAPTPRGRAFRHAVRLMDGVFDDLIARRRQDGPQGDLLDMLLEAYREDPRMLRDLVVSILMAGHETTAAGLTWSFHLLGRNPQAAERVRAEAEEVLGDDPASAVGDMKTLQRLTYSRSVFEESMRLYPPIWTFSRDALQDDRLGDSVVKAGDTVMICAYAIHRDPDVWDAPEAFRPERFLDDAPKRRHTYAYVPFGGGPRTCLGNRFAMTEAVIALALAARCFELRHADDAPVVPEPMITLRPRGGLRMVPRPV